MSDQWGLTIETEPAAEPLLKAALRRHLLIDGTDHDTVLEELELVARKAAETFTGRQFITATLELTLDRFPGRITLPRPPLQSVTSVKYDDDDGVEQTVDAADYTVQTAQHSGFIVPAYSETWPTPRAHVGAVRVLYVAGYGDSGSDVPDPILHAIRLMVGGWFEDRELVGEIPVGATRLLRPYRILSRVAL